MMRPGQRSSWVRTLPSMTTSVIVGGLLCLAGLNIQQRASWSEMEDGVLWRSSGSDVVAAEIAHGTAADRAGLQTGDVLLMIDGRAVDRVEDVVDALHASVNGARLRYTILRM
jgi:S1-C subfamily serine protease